MRRLTIAVFAMVTVLSAANAEPRVALVIGNGAYNAKLGQLANPVGDARAVAEALRRARFDVDLQTDLDQKGTRRAINRLGERMRAAGPGVVGLFYYAGHGLQAGGENFLVPTDADIEAEADLAVDGVPAAGVLKQMEMAGGAINILLLDACRNTPVLRTRGGSRGLARMDAPSGSFVVYSTAPGDAADDGAPGGHSPFAAALTAELAVPGQTLIGVFNKVGLKVQAATGKKQVPWISFSPGPDFVFIPLVNASIQTASIPAASPPPLRLVEPYSQLAVLSGHTGYVLFSAFSPDGRRIVTASADGTVGIWDVSTASLIRTLYTGAPPGQPHFVPSEVVHAGWMRSAVFSPDGRRIVTASDDKTARIWDAATGKQLSLLSGHAEAVWHAAFSPDGRTVVTASSDGTARVWDAASGILRLTLAGHSEGVWSAEYSPDGRRIVTASNDRTIRIWDSKSGAQLQVLSGHSESVFSAVFSRDGRRILTASADNTARIWDTETGAQLLVLSGHKSYVRSAAFSADEERVVTASEDKTSRVWDARTGVQVAVLNDTGYLFSCAVSPDGRRIVTASGANTARIWDAGTGTISAAP